MKTNKAYLAGGCFWCLEASFKLVPGVVEITSGYSGGDSDMPTYEEVSTELTGHAETVEIVFDPQKISYKELLNLFFIIHDPSQKDRQGADIGTQYRSAIFYINKGQETDALETVDRLKRSGVYSDIYTEVEPLKHFWPAESYHQNYFENHPEQAYCQVVIRPKLNKLNKYLKD